MKLDFSIGIGQRQGLTLTAQVQQAIKLLQMTNLEVNEYIEENEVVCVASVRIYRKARVENLVRSWQQVVSVVSA